MEHNNKQIAVFIDADNAPAAAFESILTELARSGVVSIRKAYGNWKSQSLIGWERILLEYAIQPIQQFDLTKGKNATDIALVIDALDILYTKAIDTFCIVTSDCDFTPLVTRLRADGKEVLGFGEHKAPEAFVNACSRFLYIDEKNDDDKPRAVRSKSPQELKSDSRLMNLLRGAIEASADDDGWAHLGPIGSVISNQTSFDVRNYGFAKLVDLVRAIDLFEVRQVGKGHVQVRDKRKVFRVQKHEEEAAT